MRHRQTGSCAQNTVLPLEPADPLGLGRGHPGPVIGIRLRPTHPLVQRLRADSQPRRDRLSRSDTHPTESQGSRTTYIARLPSSF